NPNQKNKKDQTQPKQLRKAHTQKEQKQKHTIENKNNHTTPGTWFLPVPPGVLAASANHQRNRNQL
ncbi:hypothetical protein MHW98_09750, partial [Winkia sp. ACRQY]|uniref:hypothetical protein n=1 Tax=Winkia sp. ACRQY TaxID=2918182 RepID=UPI001EF30332